jgi:hypothetical protein
MSAGPGRVMRTISAVIDSAGPDRFTVDDLCRRVYPEAEVIEQKHRVAVRRAMQNVAKRRRDCEVRPEWRRGAPGSSAFVLFRIDVAV